MLERERFPQGQNHRVPCIYVAKSLESGYHARACEVICRGPDHFDTLLKRKLACVHCSSYRLLPRSSSSNVSRLPLDALLF
ncbi:hypothetical protein TSMEX_010439 [Taenia solium]|eukprot:TsM_000422300 transcript=TsM_000422300 gene=TsM_000422300